MIAASHKKHRNAGPRFGIGNLDRYLGADAHLNMLEYEPSSVETLRRTQLLSEARIHPDALGRLLVDYTHYLSWTARNCLDDRIRHRVSEADVVQETFANAIKYFDNFRGTSTAEFASWLRKILINCVARQTERHLVTAGRDARREISLQALQQRADKSTYSMIDLVSNDRSPSARIEDFERLHALIGIVEQLSPEQRDCVKMRHLDGLSFREVAHELNCSETAARMRYSRGIEKIKSAASRRELS